MEHRQGKYKMLLGEYCGETTFWRQGVGAEIKRGKMLHFF
jgi:hypothetical protein